MTIREQERARRRVQRALQQLCSEKGDATVYSTLKLSRGAILNWKAGTAMPSLANCIAIHHAFGLNLMHVALGMPQATCKKELAA